MFSTHNFSRNNHLVSLRNLQTYAQPYKLVTLANQQILTRHKDQRQTKEYIHLESVCKVQVRLRSGH